MPLRLIPVSYNDEDYSLFIVMDKDTMDRIKDHDPAEINFQEMRSLQSEEWQKKKLKFIMVGFATALEMREVDHAATLEPEKMSEVLKMLSRNWSYAPDKGDGQSVKEIIRP